MSTPDATTTTRVRGSVILGLTCAQTAALGLALAVVLVAEYAAGARAVLITAPRGGAVPVAGRPVLSWLPVLGHWTARRALSQTRYVARVPT